MFIDIDSIQIKKPNGTYISLGDYNGKCLITEVKYQYNKLWSEDSGRNLAGTQSGTLRGIFPKLIVQFKKLEKDEFEAIAPILDAPKQIVKYYDPYKQAVVEMQTYTGDYEVVNKGIIETSDRRIYKNEGFSISFIAVKRRA